MNKIFILIIVLIISLAITGCDGIMTPNVPEEIEHRVTGNKALSIRFWRDSPPSKVYNNDNFEIRIDLENIGTQDIKNGIINTLVEEHYVRLKNSEDKFKAFQLNGKTDYYPGEKSTEIIELNSLTNLGAGIDAKESTVIINVCYDYETIFGESVCIDTDLNGVIQDKPCIVEDISTSEGQGAPIMITKVAEKVSSSDEGVQITFEIDISNQGEGNVISYNSIDKICGEASSSISIEKGDLNMVDIEEVEFSNLKMSSGDIVCVPERFDVMKDKFIRCRTVNPISSSLGTFTTELSVRLKYGYMETTKKDITIEQLI
jgi:hypothetical protein